MVGKKAALHRAFGAVYRFFRRETVLVISCALASVSALFVPFSPDWLDYIDFKVLACLFCLMGVVSGLRKTGLFDRAAAALTRHTTSLRTMAALLVGTTFFVSMFITNDVALITFVPFALLVLRGTVKPEYRIRIIVIQTIAANVGSALTPVGNPQNLFLFSFYGMGIGDFFAAITPVVAVGGVLLALSLYSLPAIAVKPVDAGANYTTDARMVFSYATLFVVSVLTVFRVFDYRIVAAIVFAFLLIFDRPVILRVDYSLLLTFVGFFVFIGNVRRIEPISRFVTSLVSADVTLVSAFASQIISNVPAAVFLSGFTDNAAALLRGVSIGGMGTLIASLASVISYKFFTHESPKEGFRYLLSFTVWNLLFFAVLLAFAITMY